MASENISKKVQHKFIDQIWLINDCLRTEKGGIIVSKQNSHFQILQDTDSFRVE